MQYRHHLAEFQARAKARAFAFLRSRYFPPFAPPCKYCLTLSGKFGNASNSSATRCASAATHADTC